jgi:sortase (surface protein transpeptidase)
LKDDEITLTTLDGVDFTELVQPEDLQLLADSGEATLTPVTCYPFCFVGPAPKNLLSGRRGFLDVAGLAPGRQRLTSSP